MGCYSCFFLICVLHSAIALTSGALMVFYTKEIFIIGHGIETASKLQGSTPHDQLLIQTSDSFSGLLLFTIGFLVFMVSSVRTVSSKASLQKGVCSFTFQWLFGGSALRGRLRILHMIGQGMLLETLLWPFHGSSFLSTHGVKNMISCFCYCKYNYVVCQ